MSDKNIEIIKEIQLNGQNTDLSHIAVATPMMQFMQAKAPLEEIITMDVLGSENGLAKTKRKTKRKTNNLDGRLFSEFKKG